MRVGFIGLWLSRVWGGWDIVWPWIFWFIIRIGCFYWIGNLYRNRDSNMFLADMVYFLFTLLIVRFLLNGLIMCFTSVMKIQIKTLMYKILFDTSFHIWGYIGAGVYLFWLACTSDQSEDWLNYE